MKDIRYDKLAENLINYSVELKENEKILIEITGSASDLAVALLNEVYKVKGIPFVNFTNEEVFAALSKGCNKKQLELLLKHELNFMKDMDAYIAVRASDNIFEMSDVPSSKMQLKRQIMRPVTDWRVKNTKWCVLRYPNKSMAQLAGMATPAFEDHYFNVCNLDYSKMSRAMDNLTDLMEKTDKVCLKGPGTDLKFSIKGLPAVKCDGKMNIPDGEVFTAPVIDSVNGTITYNCPAVYEGITHENIKFEFKNGKIINASSNYTDRLNNILDTDEGARFIGEFSLGVNPYITFPMKNTLFDEKIAGSIHLTPGSSYDECNNKNKSSVHWDIVLIQAKEYGGGEIWFDDVLIRKDGIFVHDKLKCLNPDELK